MLQSKKKTKNKKKKQTKNNKQTTEQIRISPNHLICVFEITYSTDLIIFKFSARYDMYCFQFSERATNELIRSKHFSLSIRNLSHEKISKSA